MIKKTCMIFSDDKDSGKERANETNSYLFRRKGCDVAAATADSTLTKTEGESCLLSQAGGIHDEGERKRERCARHTAMRRGKNSWIVKTGLNTHIGIFRCLNWLLLFNSWNDGEEGEQNGEVLLPVRDAFVCGCIRASPALSKESKRGEEDSHKII